MKYTKGDWKVVSSEREVASGERLIANCGGYRANGCNTTVENEANADLIATAVNSCIKINPDDPRAVAESIEDMYEALKDLINSLMQGAIDKYDLQNARKVLAKAKGE